MSTSVNKLPHLTRLFPHPCIFTLSCQLLNHLFQPLEEAQIRNIPSQKESRPGDLSVQPPPRRQLQLQLALHLPDLHLQTPEKRDIYDIINCYLCLLCSQTGDIVMIETLNALAQFGQLLSQLVPLLLQLLQ